MITVISPEKNQVEKWSYLKKRLTVAFQKGAHKQEGDRAKGNGFKLKERRFRLGVRKKIFTQMVVRHWHRLPGEAVYIPPLEAFSARLDGALGSQIWWVAALPMPSGLELDDL